MASIARLTARRTTDDACARLLQSTSSSCTRPAPRGSPRIHPCSTRPAPTCSSSITVEVRGNFPTRYRATGAPVWWRPDLAGADRLEDRPAQGQAVREVLRWLQAELPAMRRMRHVGGARARVRTGEDRPAR